MLNFSSELCTTRRSQTISPISFRFPKPIRGFSHLSYKSTTTTSSLTPLLIIHKTTIIRLCTTSPTRARTQKAIFNAPSQSNSISSFPSITAHQYLSQRRWVQSPWTHRRSSSRESRAETHGNSSPQAAKITPIEERAEAEAEAAAMLALVVLKRARVEDDGDDGQAVNLAAKSKLKLQSTRLQQLLRRQRKPRHQVVVVAAAVVQVGRSAVLCAMMMKCRPMKFEDCCRATIGYAPRAWIDTFLSRLPTAPRTS